MALRKTVRQEEGARREEAVLGGAPAARSPGAPASMAWARAALSVVPGEMALSPVPVLTLLWCLSDT